MLSRSDWARTAITNYNSLPITADSIRQPLSYRAPLQLVFPNFLGRVAWRTYITFTRQVKFISAIETRNNMYVAAEKIYGTTYDILTQTALIIGYEFFGFKYVRAVIEKNSDRYFS